VKKHAEFEQEVAANANGIQSLESYGNGLIRSNNFAKIDVASRLALLEKQWKLLQHQTAEKAQKLKQTKQMVDFSREVKELRDLLTAKLVIARSADIGHDLEEGEALQKRFDEFHLDVFAQEARVDALNNESGALSSQAHPQIAEIEEMKDVCFDFNPFVLS
jgi:hypothetical protein